MSGGLLYSGSAPAGEEQTHLKCFMESKFDSSATRYDIGRSDVYTSVPIQQHMRSRQGTEAHYPLLAHYSDAFGLECSPQAGL